MFYVSVFLDCPAMQSVTQQAQLSNGQPCWSV